MKQSAALANLRRNLGAIVARDCSPAMLAELITIAHLLARSCIGNKRSTGTLISMHGIPESDLAYDCIADLFQQDDRGVPFRVEAYFASYPIERMNDEELLSHFRRLVFSNVNHGVFRLLGEADPSLAKIIRNIKLSVHSLRNFVEMERFGEPTIVPDFCDPLDHLAPFDRDELFRRFLPLTSGRERIPELLAILARMLREEEEYCRRIPLVVVGFLVRSVYFEKRPDGTPDIDGATLFLSDDVRSIISEVCSVEFQRMARSYVDSGKADIRTFRAYFMTIEECLVETFVHCDGIALSFVDILRKHLPEITHEQYRQHYRHQLEYLWRTTRKEAVKRLESLR